jgi:putative FmdB family regulatory protein
MPLYEYACRNCSHTFEILVSGKRGEPDKCPKCGDSRVERLIALPAAGRVVEGQPAANCEGSGPPCGAPWCRRKG